MLSLNRAQIIGNLTRDPELRNIPSGQAVCSFGVATNRRWKAQDGQTQEDTQFHDVVAWGKLAEITAQYLKKGNKAYIEGRLQTRQWDAPDGSKRFRTEIVAENIVFLTPKGNNQTAENYPSASPKSAPAPAKETDSDKNGNSPKNAPTNTDNPTDEEINLDDIPF